MSSSNPSSVSFETSFDNDVAFKSLIESNNNKNTNDNNTNSISNSNNNTNSKSSSSHDQQSLNNVTNLAAPRSDQDQQQQQQQQESPKEDLDLFISDLLEQMQSKFENMGNTILGRIDGMGSRMDTLERSIGDLMDQSGLSEPTRTYGSSSGNVMKTITDKSDN